MNLLTREEIIRIPANDEDGKPQWSGGVPVRRALLQTQDIKSRKAEREKIKRELEGVFYRTFVTSKIIEIKTQDMSSVVKTWQTFWKGYGVGGDVSGG